VQNHTRLNRFIFYKINSPPEDSKQANKQIQKATTSNTELEMPINNNNTYKE